MNEITIELPLPYKQLSPNARSCWQMKAKFTKLYRRQAWLTARAKLLDIGADPPRWGSVSVVCVFYFQTTQQHDGDNLIAQMKSAFDGLADAGIVVNDSGIAHLPPVQMRDARKPGVVIIVSQNGVAS